MYVARFILELQTPLHCGGGEDVTQDQPVSRDAFGFWRIPGSSVAGILRGWMRDQTDIRGVESRLFGKQEGVNCLASLIWCEDARLLDFDEVPVVEKVMGGQEVAIPQGPYIRDHVRLGLGTEVAEEGGFFAIKAGDRAYEIEQKYGYSTEEIFTSGFYTARPMQFFEFYREEMLKKK